MKGFSWFFKSPFVRRKGHCTALKMLQLYFHFSSEPLPFFGHFVVFDVHFRHIFVVIHVFVQVIMRPIFRVLINPKWLSQCNKLGFAIMTCFDALPFHPPVPLFSVLAVASSKFMFIIISVFILRCFRTEETTRKQRGIPTMSIFGSPFQRSSYFWHSRREWIGWKKRGQQNIALS